MRNRHAMSVCQPTSAAYTGFANSAPDPNEKVEITVSATPTAANRDIDGEAGRADGGMSVDELPTNVGWAPDERPVRAG